MWKIYGWLVKLIRELTVDVQCTDRPSVAVLTLVLRGECALHFYATLVNQPYFFQSGDYSGTSV